VEKTEIFEPTGLRKIIYFLSVLFCLRLPKGKKVRSFGKLPLIFQALIIKACLKKKRTFLGGKAVKRKKNCYNFIKIIKNHFFKR